MVGVAGADLVGEGHVVDVDPELLAARLQPPLQRQHGVADLVVERIEPEALGPAGVRIVVVVDRRVAAAAHLVAAHLAGQVFADDVARVLGRRPHFEAHARQPEVHRLVEELVEHVLLVVVVLEVGKRRLRHRLPAVDGLVTLVGHQADRGGARLVAIGRRQQGADRQDQEDQQQREPEARGGGVGHVSGSWAKWAPGSYSRRGDAGGVLPSSAFRVRPGPAPEYRPRRGRRPVHPAN
jgi:hypothetical protein